MSLKARLEDDMKTAMRERESGRFRLSVIRMVRAAVKNAEIDLQHELSEEEVLAVLAKELKMRRDSLAEFDKAGRRDLADAAREEIAILLAYLPSQLSAEEVRALAEEAVKSSGAVSPKDMGKVMGLLQPKVKGRADGKLVSDIVKELLNKA